VVISGWGHAFHALRTSVDVIYHLYIRYATLAVGLRSVGTASDFCPIYAGSSPGEPTLAFVFFLPIARFSRLGLAGNTVGQPLKHLSNVRRGGAPRHSARIHGWPGRPSGRRLSPAGTYVSGVACSHPAPRSRQQYIMPLSACIGSQVCAACRIHLVKGCQTHGGRMMACGPAGPRVHADVSACLHARQLRQGQDAPGQGVGCVNTMGLPVTCEGMRGRNGCTHEREVSRSDCSAHLHRTCSGQPSIYLFS
jgi:hypothetical protein